MGLYALRDYHKELLQLEQQNRERLLMARQEEGQRQAHETSDEPSYEYAHDHEDQHDDPPTPKPQQNEFYRLSEAKQSTETELDAYERLLAPSSASSEPEAGAKPSILSTLTTTERTTAPDGTITTKVVLKKRFADGSEQSSETIHTQRGEDVHRTEDSWMAMQNAQASDNFGQRKEKKGGWFWSN
jgi:hypothetical protein